MVIVEFQHFHLFLSQFSSFHSLYILTHTQTQQRKPQQQLQCSLHHISIPNLLWPLPGLTPDPWPRRLCRPWPSAGGSETVGSVSEAQLLLLAGSGSLHLEPPLRPPPPPAAQGYTPLFWREGARPRRHMSGRTSAATARTAGNKNMDGHGSWWRLKPLLLLPLACQGAGAVSSQVQFTALSCQNVKLDQICTSRHCEFLKVVYNWAIQWADNKSGSEMMRCYFHRNSESESSNQWGTWRRKGPV